MVQIVLSTYNGGKYLQEFLDSLLNQTCKDFKLIVRDDASTDNTVNILKQYSLVDKLFISQDNIGVVGSFNCLLKEFIYNSKDEYLLFADQDDVWSKNKIELLLNYANNKKPLLIHSDLSIVDQELNLINSSFFKYKNLNPYCDDLSNILFQNIATGCTMLINRKLASLIYPIPKEAIMHDWWILLVAKVFGEIKFIDEALLLYRQHDNNTIGVYNKNLFRKYISLDINKYFIQAKKFLEVYDSLIDLENKKTIKHFLELNNGNFMNRKFKFLISNFRKYNLVNNIGVFIKC